jgi:peptidoglycan/LPS O-acetylase OafA/YrhL
MNTRAERFPYIDSLRAFAALSIVATHAALHAGGSWILPVAARLESGVAIFFLISGFLLYRPFARARLTEQKPPRAAAYAWRRGLRIVPAYWVALTLITIAIGTPGTFSGDAPLYYGIAQTWTQHTIGGGLAQGWTLAIEVTFYAFVPLWALGMRRLARNRDGQRPLDQRVRTELIALATLFAFSIAWKLGFLAAGDAHRVSITPALESLPGYLDQFALGMTVAVLSIWVEESPQAARPLRRTRTLLARAPWLPWALAAGAFAVAAWGIGLSGRLLEPFTPAQYLARHLLYTAIGLGVLIPAVVGANGLVGWILSRRTLMWLGLISYSIYLYSAAVLTQLERWGAGPAANGDRPFVKWAALAMLATIPVAAASYYLVERPALKLKRLVPARGTLPAPAVSQEVDMTAPRA